MPRRGEDYEEDVQTDQYQTEDQYGNQGYGQTTETTYETEDGGYGRREENYEVNPDAGYGQATVVEDEQRLDGIETARRQETTYKREEHGGEAAGLIGAGIAMYERREERKDPEHARRHKIEEEVAEGLAVGGVGTAIYGHHEKEKEEDDVEQLEGKKKHSWF